jgi:hypothetical protein
MIDRDESKVSVPHIVTLCSFVRFAKSMEAMIDKRPPYPRRTKANVKGDRET